MGSGSETLKIIAKNKVTTDCERNFEDFEKLEKIKRLRCLSETKGKIKNQTLRPSSKTF
jgi:hypothetical protein